MHIVFAENQAERLNGKKIAAAGVTQNMAPAASSLDPVAAPSRHRRSASSVNDNPVTVIERSRQTRIAVAAGHYFRVRPDLETDLPERAAIFFRCATCQENSRAIDFLRQF